MGASQSQAEGSAEGNMEINFDHFQVLRAIGKGSFGKVCIVKRKSNDQMYAMKYMNKRKCLEKEAVQNVIREIQILSSLDHPFIINLKFSFQDEEDMFMITDLLLGGDLRFHLSQGVIFSDESVRFYLCQLFMAVDYLRTNNIIHRDIKPENIILSETGYLYLCDFNVATVVKEDSALQSMSGTLPYIAPEVFDLQLEAGSSGYSYSVDWWSLGVVALELCTGQHPFGVTSGCDPAEVPHLLSQPPRFPARCQATFAEIVGKLLCRDPVGRLSSLEDAKRLPYLQQVDLQSIYEKQATVPFIPPQKALNCDPTHELEEMIIEAHPLHKKKKRLQKQRSIREAIGQQQDMPADPLQGRLERVAGDFLVFDREKEQARRQEMMLEEDWERELTESMQRSEPISQVDRSVIEKIRRDLLEGAVPDRTKTSRSVQALTDLSLERTSAAREKEGVTSSQATPSRRRHRRPGLKHQMTVT